MTYQTAIRRLIWVYFLLIIFEGALRKWVIPGAHELLIFARDPVVLLIYLLAVFDNRFPWKSQILQFALWLAILSLALSPFGRWFDLITVIYGFRVQFFHLPLIFVMAAYFKREDVVQMGRWTLLLGIPIALLMVAQFEAPRGSRLNVGVGGELNGQIMGAQGHYRPPGPFAFITGPVLFFPLLAAFWLAALVHRNMVRYWLILAAGAALAVAIPISISRSLASLIGLVVLALIVAGLVRPRLIVHLMRVMIVMGIVIAVVASLSVVRTGSDVFAHRWEVSGGDNVKSAIWDRVLGGYLNPFREMLDMPIMGYGLGTGTNVAAKRISGHVGFLHAEGEWERVVLEMGPVLGPAYLLLRVWLALQLVWVSWRALFRGDVLPWLITAAVFTNVLNGQWGPPTGHGFAILGAGLVLAAAGGSAKAPLRKKKENLRTSRRAIRGGAHIDVPLPAPVAPALPQETMVGVAQQKEAAAGHVSGARVEERNID